MNEEETIGERLKRLRKEAGLTQAQLAAKVGLAQSAIGNIEAGTRGYGASILLIAEALKTEPGFLQMMSRATRSPEPIPLDSNPEYPAIRKVKFKLSAGASGFGVDYEGEDHQPIVFGKYWYEVNKLRPEALFAVRVANGSMEPGLHNGDIVVVNTLSTQPKDGTVFAINYEGEMVIKRLIRDEGEWWLHSDNPDQVRYKRKRMHGDCFLIGEVIQKQSMHI